jgi:hypothetical protein
LEQAPGWRVVEHPRRSPWRAGYVILPVALVVGALQLFVASDDDRVEWSGRRQASAPDVTSATGEGAVRAGQAERQPTAGAGARANPAEPATAAPARTRVFILHRTGVRNAVPAIQLAVYLQERGFAVTDIRAVDEPIKRPSVRYFSDDDQRDSRRLAEAIEAFFANAPDQAPDEVVNLSHAAPQPGEGKVEVWLPEPPDEAS